MRPDPRAWWLVAYGVQILAPLKAEPLPADMVALLARINDQERK